MYYLINGVTYRLVVKVPVRRYFQLAFVDCHRNMGRQSRLVHPDDAEAERDREIRLPKKLSHTCCLVHRLFCVSALVCILFRLIVDGSHTEKAN